MNELATVIQLEARWAEALTVTMLTDSPLARCQWINTGNHRATHYGDDLWIKLHKHEMRT